jgi:hypothetical protein
LSIESIRHFSNYSALKGLPYSKFCKNKSSKKEKRETVETSPLLWGYFQHTSPILPSTNSILPIRHNNRGNTTFQKTETAIFFHFSQSKQLYKIRNGAM